MALAANPIYLGAAQLGLQKLFAANNKGPNPRPKQRTHPACTLAARLLMVALL